MAIHKSAKSAKVFTLKIIRLYGILIVLCIYKNSSRINWPLIIGDNRLIGISKIQSYNKETEG